MATNKIEKLKKEIASMEAVYSKQSTSEGTKKILKRSIDAAKAKLQKQEELGKKLKTAMYGPKPAEEPKKDEPKKEEPAKPKKAAKPSTALSKLMRRVRSKGYEPYKGKKIDLLRDAGKKAKAPGKKVSKSGRTYWESRPNRVDIKQKAKSAPYLKDGGTVPSSAYGDMLYNTLEMALSSIKTLVNPQNYSILKKDKKYMVTTNRRSGIFLKEGWENFGHVLSNSTLYRGTIGRLEYGGVAGYDEGGEMEYDSYEEAKFNMDKFMYDEADFHEFHSIQDSGNANRMAMFIEENLASEERMYQYFPKDGSIEGFAEYLVKEKGKGGYMAGGGEIPNTVEEFKKNMNNFEYKMGQAEKEWKKDNGEKYKQIRNERDEYVEKTKKAWYKTLSEEEKSNGGRYTTIKRMIEDAGLSYMAGGGKSDNIIDSYFEVATKSPSVDSLKKSKEGDGFTFVNKDDNECKVTVYYDEDSETVVMKQDYQDGNPPEDDEVSLSSFKKYLSNDKMKDGGYMAKGGGTFNAKAVAKQIAQTLKERKMSSGKIEEHFDIDDSYYVDIKHPDYELNVTQASSGYDEGITVSKNGETIYFGMDIEKAISKLSKKKFEEGGDTSSPNVNFMKWFVDWSKGVDEHIRVSISIPNEFSSPVKDDSGKIVMLDVIEKKGDADAKKYMDEILKKADEFGVSIYLQPIPRTHNLKSQEHKDKITKDYLIKYYGKFGFENTDGGFMVRAPKMAEGGKVGLSKKLEGYYKKAKNYPFSAKKIKVIDENTFSFYNPSFNSKVVMSLEDDAVTIHEKYEDDNFTEDKKISLSDFEDYLMEEYAEGGYMAKGGATEHGLMVGDMIVLAKGPILGIIDENGEPVSVNIETGDRRSAKEKKEEGGKTEYASGGNVMKEYEKVEGTNYELKIQVYYDKGGMNYFTSRPEQRGYYASVSPVQVERRGDGITVESYSAFSGVRMLVLPVQRQSPKAEAEARKKAMEVLPELKEAIKERIKKSTKPNSQDFAGGGKTDGKKNIKIRVFSSYNESKKPWYVKTESMTKKEFDNRIKNFKVKEFEESHSWRVDTDETYSWQKGFINMLHD